MSAEYGDRAQFIFVYIREAHPSDEWWLDSNKQANVNFAQPTTFEQRQEVAQSCSLALSLSMPCVVDDMQNSADEAYAAWPERLFVVDVDGRIAYAGKQGPFGFEPDEVRAWLNEHLGGQN